MLKIATHDSATGEKGRGILSWLVTPFAKTQSLTIDEQYVAGCRSFDLRVKKVGDQWLCAHGLWKSKRTFADIIKQLASYGDRCQVCVTYEGKAEHNEELIDLYNRMRKGYKHIIWGYLAVKYGKDSNGLVVKYDIIQQGHELYEGGVQGFLALDGRSWHTLLPIPWLWKKIYHNKPVFNESHFTYVDFLQKSYEQD